jgi:anti-sigma factor RsiW
VTVQHPHAELSAYIDDALDPAARAAVDGHLVACAACRAHVAQLRATTTFLQALPDPIPSRRLVPRLAVPAWLAPLRTVMTLASGTAVFLFIASALASNITFLAGAPAVGTTAREASGDTTANAQAPKGVQQGTSAPVPAASPGAAFSVSGPTPAPAADARSAADRVRLDDAKRSGDSPTAAPTAAPDAAAALQEAGRGFSAVAPQRSPLVNPWLWLTLAILCGAIAIALHRRLRVSA